MARRLPDHLQLPDHGVKTKHGPDGLLVFDPARRMWVRWTPEEWVRQHFLNYLVHDLGCPLSLIAMERKLVLNGLTKRFDMLVHGTDGKPLALVECKAPNVDLDQGAFDQAARYNKVVQVPLLIVTNGLRHFACLSDRSTGSWSFLDHLPDHDRMMAFGKA